MLNQSTRAAILKLHEQGHSIRGIARAMELSRGAVRHVLRSATDVVPQLERPEKAMPYREQILELYQRCKGNLVRVYEELVAAGAQLSYPALTAFCRRQEIGRSVNRRSENITSSPARRCSTTPLRIELRSAAIYAWCKPPPWSSVIPVCCSSSFFPLSLVSTARCSSPMLSSTSAAVVRSA